MPMAERALRVVGVSHRELSDEALARVIPGATESGGLQALLSTTGVPHVLLVTCNRLECYWAGDTTSPGAELQTWLSARTGAGGALALRALHGEFALEHLVRVAAGLESMLVGDTDVLGQVRRAWLSARAASTTDRWLDRIFERVIHAARRVQHDTTRDLAVRSIGMAAIEAIRSRLDTPWDEAVVAVIGSGAAATSALAAMAIEPPRALQLTGRTPERVAQLARRTGAVAVEWRSRHALIRDADVAVFALRADQPVFADDDAALLLADRQRSTPPLWADLGMPPNIALACPPPSLQLLTLPTLMRSAAVCLDLAMRESMARELRFLQGALHRRAPRGALSHAAAHARSA